jgi:hypothetical protein
VERQAKEEAMMEAAGMEAARRIMQQQDEGSAADRYRALGAELEALVQSGQYDGPRAGEVLAEMGRLWDAMTPDEREACADRLAAQAAPAVAMAEPTSVTCTMAVWLECGPDWLRLHPTVTRVEITDRAPVYDPVLGGRWCWFHRDTQPVQVETSVPCGGAAYRTEQEALEAFSEACLAWARAQR